MCYLCQFKPGPLNWIPWLQKKDPFSQFLHPIIQVIEVIIIVSSDSFTQSHTIHALIKDLLLFLRFNSFCDRTVSEDVSWFHQAEELWGNCVVSVGIQWKQKVVERVGKQAIREGGLVREAFFSSLPSLLLFFLTRSPSELVTCVSCLFFILATVLHAFE